MLYAGIDEVGVSSVAGSMVASVVVLPENHGIKELPVDSKLLSEKKIEKIAKKILEVAIVCKTYKLLNEEVDKLGDFSLKKIKLLRVKAKQLDFIQSLAALFLLVYIVY